MRKLMRERESPSDRRVRPVHADQRMATLSDHKAGPDGKVVEKYHWVSP
jgi:hypothetical protein